ncbi:MAG TPA: hypothetical protein VL092_11310 [Chitinophagaceae bacterium]|nr:hypothetical protein [Chitinophagaceae bacterium]
MAKSLKRSSEPDKADKILVWIACAVFLTLSVLFYKERIAFADTAAYVSHIIARNTFEVSMHSRFVGALTQVFLYLGIQLGLPLKALMILYSVNFALIPIACALISVRWFKETRTAWSILLFYTLMSFYMFYYPVSEYQVGLGLFLFYIGLYHHYQAGGVKPFVFVLLSLLLIPCVIFCHPLAAPVFISWIVFQLCCEPAQKRALALVTLGGIASYLVKRQFFSIEYEEKKSDVVDNFLKFSFDELVQNLGRSSLKIILQDYFLLIILSVATIVVLIWQHKKLAAILFPLILIGWWVLVTVSFMNESYDHYYEHMYQALPLFIALGFCTFVLPVLSAAPRIILLTAIMAISFTKIVNGQGWLAERFAWMNRCFKMMDTLHCKKAIFTQEHIPGGRYCMASWAIPYESLLISSLDDPKQSKIILMKGNLEDALKVDREVLDVDPDSNPNYPVLGEKYFRITGEQYCIPQTTIDIPTIEYLKTGKKN